MMSVTNVVPFAPSLSPQAPSENLLTSDTPSQKQPTTSNDDHSQDVVPLRDGNPLAAASLCDTNPSERPSINSDDNPCVDEAINVNHAELLIHVILDKDMFKLVDGIDAFPFSLPFALKTALESPYVLHQLLAFSARHMAFLHPQRSAFYLHQAVTLQTRAVSLFNATWTAVDQSNCVAVLAFSSFLGHHLLADTLAKRDPEDGLDAFISQYVRFLEMHRGIFAVATAAWPLLMATELEPILTRSSSFTSRPPRGSHCQRVLELVDGANGLEEEDREACRQSIRYLQVGFDAALAEEGEEEQGFRYQMIISWSMLAPPGVTALLAVKRPEALVIMGYYALLLHHGRNMWQIGDAGAYIFGIIVDYLGPEWDHWLEYPRQTIAADLE
ncbi:MAG: hypothetical protein M1821_008913 [Bathelium mastoideum]|nr:MAG: hypothetical protein M1821_008913 [Bathelium mastoideum]